MSGIVVGVDGSPHSQKALDWALTEASLRHTPLTVVAVSSVAASTWGLAAEHYPADEQGRAAVQQATQELVDKAVTAHGDGTAPTVTVHAVSGRPADELIKASEDADLLVVGARGAGGFAKLMMGSVSSQVTHHAGCPVAVIPGEHAR